MTTFRGEQIWRAGGPWFIWTGFLLKVDQAEMNVEVQKPEVTEEAFRGGWLRRQSVTLHLLLL